MQATARISYEACGTIFRFRDFVRDNGRTLRNGMDSTVSERAQNWVDDDGSAAGYTVPLLIGSATAEAAGWWRLDDACVQEGPAARPYDRTAPLWLCERRDARQIGSVNMVWDQSRQDGLGYPNFCANGDQDIKCIPGMY